MNLGLNASGSESEEGEGGGRPLVLLVRINLLQHMFSFGREVFGQESFWAGSFWARKFWAGSFLERIFPKEMCARERASCAACIDQPAAELLHNPPSTRVLNMCWMRVVQAFRFNQ